MARSKTTSPTIGFRVPLDLWPELERRAAAKGKSPGEYVRMLTVNYLQRQVSAPPDDDGD